MPSRTVFIILILVGTSMNAGVFRYNPDARGKCMYRIYLEDKVMCLKACYEEPDCTLVTYEEIEAELCEVYASGNSDKVPGYTFSREETDAACNLIEISDTAITFQSIPSKELPEVECSNAVSVNTVIIPYTTTYKGMVFLFYVPNFAKIPGNWKEAEEYRLIFSKKKEETCTPIPIFHKANTRRLYFGNVFNTTRFYFYNAYAYADYCVSPKGECLGVVEIQEYFDKKTGHHIYDKPGRKDLEDSGLGQKFFIAGIEKSL